MATAEEEAEFDQLIATMKFRRKIRDVAIPYAEQCVADALRKVASKLIAAVDEKYINRTTVDADTLAETLLAIADELEA